MSEELNTNDDELAELKSLADTMGVSYHPNIGLEKLREKVFLADEKLGATKPIYIEEEEAAPAKKSSKVQKMTSVKQRATKLVRIRVSCMDPTKQGLPGEIFSTGNKYSGRIKKYVPFDTPWHVPAMLLGMIQRRQCQIFTKKRERSDSGAMVEMTRGKLVKSYSVEILPDLTQKEIDDLGKRQLARQGTESAN